MNGTERRNIFKRLQPVAPDCSRKGKADFTGQGPEQRSET
jgi:hypothetical protein